MARFAGEMPNVRVVGRAVTKGSDLGSCRFFLRYLGLKETLDFLYNISFQLWVVNRNT